MDLPIGCGSQRYPKRTSPPENRVGHAASSAKASVAISPSGPELSCAGRRVDVKQPFLRCQRRGFHPPVVQPQQGTVLSSSSTLIIGSARPSYHECFSGLPARWSGQISSRPRLNGWRGGVGVIVNVEPCVTCPELGPNYRATERDYRLDWSREVAANLLDAVEWAPMEADSLDVPFHCQSRGRGFKSRRARQSIDRLEGGGVLSPPSACPELALFS